MPRRFRFAVRCLGPYVAALAFGLLMTVGVAGLCAIPRHGGTRTAMTGQYIACSATTTDEVWRHMIPKTILWMIEHHRSFGRLTIVSRCVPYDEYHAPVAAPSPSTLIPTWSDLHDAAAVYEEQLAIRAVAPEEYLRTNSAYGWPFRCLWYGRRMTTIEHGLPVTIGRVDVTMPLRPIVIPFVANALLYAIAARLLWLTPRSIRHWRRRARALCMHCAYPLSGRSHCPECGHGHAVRSAVT